VVVTRYDPIDPQAKVFQFGTEPLLERRAHLRHHEVGPRLGQRVQDLFKRVELN
jgi:hypothetical protein